MLILNGAHTSTWGDNILGTLTRAYYGCLETGETPETVRAGREAIERYEALAGQQTAVETRFKRLPVIYDPGLPGDVMELWGSAVLARVVAIS